NRYLERPAAGSAAANPRNHKELRISRTQSSGVTYGQIVGASALIVVELRSTGRVRRPAPTGAAPGSTSLRAELDWGRHPPLVLDGRARPALHRRPDV